MLDMLEEPPAGWFFCKQSPSEKGLCDVVDVGFEPTTSRM